jgi:hypothetical protein
MNSAAPFVRGLFSGFPGEKTLERSVLPAGTERRMLGAIPS